MRTGLLAFILATTAFTPAFAAEIAANSKIDAVTVFPQGAEVTRIAEARSKRASTRSSSTACRQNCRPIRCASKAQAPARIEIGSVDSKLILPAAGGRCGSASASRRISRCSATNARALDQAINDAEYQKSLMQQLGNGDPHAAAEGRRDAHPRCARPRRRARSRPAQARETRQDHPRCTHAPARDRPPHQRAQYEACARSRRVEERSMRVTVHLTRP